MLDDIRPLIERHLPYLEIHTLSRLGEGLQNVAYDVNGELVVRLSREVDHVARAELVSREAALLTAVAALSPLPVPDLLFVDAENGIMGYRKLPGVPLLEHPVDEPERLAPALGEFLSQLHRAPVNDMAKLVPDDDEPLTSWRDEAEGHYRQIAEHLTDPARTAVERFLAQPPPADPATLTFCHNDLGSEHILVDPAAGSVTGIIDWADAAIADPTYELALIFRDLGPKALDVALAHYDRDFDGPERERMLFYARCALLEDLYFGFRTHKTSYATAGMAHLSWTFDDLR